MERIVLWAGTYTRIPTWAGLGGQQRVDNGFAQCSRGLILGLRSTAEGGKWVCAERPSACNRRDTKAVKQRGCITLHMGDTEIYLCGAKKEDMRGLVIRVSNAAIPLQVRGCFICWQVQRYLLGAMEDKR